MGWRIVPEAGRERVGLKVVVLRRRWAAWVAAALLQR